MAEKDDSYDPFAIEKFAPTSFADWAKQAAPKDWEIIRDMVQGTASLPKRSIEAASQYQVGSPDTYNPAPAVEAAMMTMGVGGPMAEAGALGSAGGKLAKKAWMDQSIPVDIWSSETKVGSLIPGQMVQAGPGGPVGMFKGISPGGTVQVDWKAKPAETPQPDAAAPAPKPSFAYSSGEAKGKFQQNKEDIWKKLREEFQKARGIEPPKTSLLDIMPDKIKSGLDPVEQARLKGGYTEPAYRGFNLGYKGQKEGPNPIHKFGDEGEGGGYSEMYSTADPMLADMYAGGLSSHPGEIVPPGTFMSGSTVAPLWVNPKEYLHTDAGGKNWSEFNWKAIKEAREQGKKGVVINNVWDEPGSTQALGSPKKVFITFPEGLPTVKSKFANKFDPTDPNMLHGAAAIGTGGGAGYAAMSEPGKSAEMKDKEDGGNQGKQSGGDTPKMSPGVMKWMMEFLKANPDLAKEMSTRMNAVINGKTIQAQQGKGPPPPPGGAQMPGMAGPPGAGGAPPQMPGAMPPQMPKPPGM